MSDTGDRMARLETARAQAVEVEEKGKRLQWDLEQHEKGLEEVEKEAKEKYGCDVSELGEAAAAKEAEADEKLKLAEAILSGEVADPKKAQSPEETKSDAQSEESTDHSAVEESKPVEKSSPVSVVVDADGFLE